MRTWTRSRGRYIITVSPSVQTRWSSLILETANHNRMLASVLDTKTPATPPRLSTVFTFAADTSLSTVKLASVPTPSGALILMSSPGRPTSSVALFHPSYPAVIDARDLPRSLSTVRDVIMFSPRMAGLLVRTVSAEDKDKEKDAVYLVDVTVPAGGIGIAQLLSSAEATAKFILPTTAPTAVEETEENNTVAQRDRAFLSSFAQALKQDTPAAAVEVFNAYEIAEGDPFALRTKKLLKIREQESRAVKSRSTGKLVGEIVRLVLENALGSQPAGEGEAEAEVVGTRGVYPYAVVRSLIKREWVSDGMWSRGGVVRALLALGDWVRPEETFGESGWMITDASRVGLNHARASTVTRHPLGIARRRRSRRLASTAINDDDGTAASRRAGSLPRSPMLCAAAPARDTYRLERDERCHARARGVCRMARGVQGARGDGVRVGIGWRYARMERG